MLFSVFKISQYTFEGIFPDEKTRLFLQRHWFVLLGRALFFLLLFTLPFILYAFLPDSLPAGFADIYWFLASIYFLFWWAGAFYAYTMYLLDMWIVTDHRIIDKRQFGFFNHTVAELKLSRVQDISIHINGIIPTFLNFGDLEVQTAGTENKFSFKQIPDPATVKNEIMKAYNAYMKKRHNSAETSNVAQV